jgi:hypothetical protein
MQVFKRILVPAILKTKSLPICMDSIHFRCREYVSGRILKNLLFRHRPIGLIWFSDIDFDDDKEATFF